MMADWINLVLFLVVLSLVAGAVEVSALATLATPRVARGP